MSNKTVNPEDICYCRECIRHRKLESIDSLPNWCILWNEMMSDDDYCSRGTKEE